MASNCRNATGEDGFSILEMIVAMTILALVLGIASQAVILARRSVDAAGAQVELARRVQELVVLLGMDTGRSPDAIIGEETSDELSVKVSDIRLASGGIRAIQISDANGKSRVPFLTFLPTPRAAEK